MNQIIVGAVQGDLVPIRYGFELFDRAKSDKKNIFVVEGASHYELYDKPDYVRQKSPQTQSMRLKNSSRVLLGRVESAAASLKYGIRPHRAGSPTTKTRRRALT